MPASYVHQCAALRICGALSLAQQEPLQSAMLAGCEGPDPLFFSLLPASGPLLPALGRLLHTQRTDDFLLALADACRDDALSRAYCLGFFAHYAADTVFHPFIYAHALTKDGKYSTVRHSALEHRMDKLLYRRQGHEKGLPEQMAGFAHLSKSEKDVLAAALSCAVQRVFPERAPGTRRIRRSFDDAVRLSRLHAHAIPSRALHTDVMNDTHRPWRSLWQPDAVRHDSFDELFDAAVRRGCELVDAADGYMHGRISCRALRALHGGLSYSSGLPWQTTCPPAKAPGILTR